MEIRRDSYNNGQSRPSHASRPTRNDRPSNRGIQRGTLRPAGNRRPKYHDSWNSQNRDDRPPPFAHTPSQHATQDRKRKAQSIARDSPPHEVQRLKLEDPDESSMPHSSRERTPIHSMGSGLMRTCQRYVDTMSTAAVRKLHTQPSSRCETSFACGDIGLCR